MGIAAIRSHEISKMHKGNLENVHRQSTVTSFFRTPASASSTSSASTTTTATTSATPKPTHSFVIKEAVTRAEIIWALKSISSHYSFRSSGDVSELFQTMFPDSDIAKQFSMGYDKIAYVVTYGLAPYYRNKLCATMSDATEFVVCFDESLNKIAQRCQMDVIVRFFDMSTCTVSTRYLTSVFLGHSTAQDLKSAFTGALVGAGLDLKLLLQVSMDGPNVNWRFLALLKQHLHEFDSDTDLLEIGSCGLHVLNGAFQNGHSQAGWNINGFLGWLYYLFKDSPARRADFIRITATSKFAKKFCRIRWTENSDVVDRALEIIPAYRKYVSEVKPAPKVQSFARLKESFEDPLLVAKLQFFRSVSQNVEPFLVKFQSDKPMAPFLFDELLSVTTTLLKRFIKPEVVTTADTPGKLMKIDITPNGPNCQLLKYIDIGFGAARAFSASGDSDLKNMEFREDCKKFLWATVSKIFERSPLKYPVVRAISSVSPKVIVQTPTLAASRMQKLLEILVDANIVPVPVAESAKNQFSKFCACGDAKAALRGFVDASDRLDALYYPLLANNSDYDAIWQVVSKTLILSHGNASVESGFSINADMLVTNLHESSLIAQRLVYDGLKADGGIPNLVVGKEMYQSVRAARGRYRDALETKKQTAATDQNTAKQRKRAANEVEALKAKKRQMETEAANVSKAMELQIEELQRLAK